VTFTSASPTVVTWNSHGLSAGRMVRFTSNGSMPIGVTSGQTYYVSATGLGVNSFQIEDLDGVAINTSSTGSGTITGLAFWGAVPVFYTDDSNANTSINTNIVTITIASPGVITWSSHGLSKGQPVQFSTTGALPTGITAGTTYYVSSSNL